MVGRLLLLLAGGAALVWLRADEPFPVVSASTTSGMTSLLGDVALHMAVLVGVWALAAALLGWLRRLPGRLGRAVDRTWAWLVPTALRAALLGATGAAVVTSTATAVAATAPATAARLEVGRPLTSAPPVAASAVPTVKPTVTAEASVQSRVVAPGDSLWAIATQHLGPNATPAQVAAEWPRWYASNRDVVGPDPDLLRVGTVLEAPRVGGTR